MGLRHLWLVAAAVAAACDETPGDVVGVLPALPEAGTTTSTAVSTFAIDTIFLGEAPFDGGPPSNTFWKGFGYNLDGLTTTKVSTNVCTLAAGAPPVNQVDGINGIDNAWGSTVLPIIQTLASQPTPSTTESGFIDDGLWTLELEITGLTDDVHQTALGLDLQVFTGTDFGGRPGFAASTHWPVSPSSLNDGGALSNGALVHYSNVYVRNGTVVANGATNPLVLPLVVPSLSGRSGSPCICFFSSCSGDCDAGPPPSSPPGPPMSTRLTVRVHNPIVTWERNSPNVVTGVIAGVLDTQEFVDTFVDVARHAGPTFCGAVTDGFVQQLRQAQDILNDDTNRSALPCNAISIGVGFTAHRIASPTTVGTDPVPIPDLCGADASPD